MVREGKILKPDSYECWITFPILKNGSMIAMTMIPTSVPTKTRTNNAIAFRIHEGEETTNVGSPFRY